MKLIEKQLKSYYKDKLFNHKKFNFITATKLKIRTYVLISNFTRQKQLSKKLHPIRKRPYQIIDKPTDLT